MSLGPAVRGALAFLTRIPVGADERHWDAFRRTPAAFPLTGYVVGGLVALPFALSLLVPLPAATVAALYLVGVYLVTGVSHADGLTDLGDAAAVHGPVGADGVSSGDGAADVSNGDEADVPGVDGVSGGPTDGSGDPVANDGAGGGSSAPSAAVARRRAVLDDPAAGVGGVLALGLALAGLALGAFGLARAGPTVAVAVVLAAEVGAKAGMAALACLGTPAHEGLGSSLAGGLDSGSLPAVAVAAAPAVLLAPLADTAAPVAALLAAPAVALLVGRWARRRLGGVSGDVFGAANELGRVAALHAGVVTWATF